MRLRGAWWVQDGPRVDMHPNQLRVSVDLVGELVAGQFPRWASLPIHEVAARGTVNALFRIGDRLAARFPLQPVEPAVARERLEAEAASARELLDRVPFPTPRPVALGEPGAGYPLPWSVQSWLPGTVATETDPGGWVGFAHDLARLVRSMRAIDTGGRRFAGQGRGGDLRAHDTWMETCFRSSEDLLDVPRLRRVWACLRETPRATPYDVMTHGDLIPGNVLVADGRLAGVIDVGGFGPADPALDLVAAWHLLDDGPRQVLRDDLGPDDAEWARGQAWAFEQAMGAVWYYVASNPSMSLMGHRTIERILAARAS